MALDLNEIVIPYKEFSREATGHPRNLDQMPALIAEGRTPASIARVLERRLRSGKKDWKNHYFDTGDAFLYHPNGKVKIVLDAQLLRGINPDSNLRNGALVLEDGVYESTQGYEFERGAAGLILGRDLTAEEAKVHPLWRVFARDQSLLNEYVDAMFPEMRQRRDYNNAMGLYLDSAEKVPVARAVCVYWLGGRSRLVGRFGLGIDYGRLVGVAPEAPSAPGKA